MGPGSPCDARRADLESLDIATLAGRRKVVDDEMALGCIAGLWLLHDFLDESHAISQQIPTPSGSYWHALMHRREPDYTNAKYWFRRVGDHPIFDRLRLEAAAIAKAAQLESGNVPVPQPPRWDPMLFIDLCDAMAGSGTPAEELCRDIAHVEWQLLFDYCFQQATRPN